MKRRAWAHQIGTILDALFPAPSIPLQHKDPYTLLIAVLLSAQCQDARVNKVTPLLFALADTPQAMVSLSIATIESVIRPCGLAHRKATAISQLSQHLLTHHRGHVPRTLAALEALPGVGHKTASVVRAQAFHCPAFPVDTHIHRLAHRWHLSDGTHVRKTERDLKRLFPRREWIRRHLQLIYFARAYCPARGHHSKTCPICSLMINRNDLARQKNLGAPVLSPRDRSRQSIR